MRAAPAVYRDDLTGDIRRVLNQEAYRTRDVLWAAFAFEQGVFDDAPYITGQIIAVDGGRSAHL